MYDGELKAMSGRVLAIRPMGGIAFGTILTCHAEPVNEPTQFQISFNKKDLGEAKFKELLNFKSGDIIQVSGTIWTTGRGVKTLSVSNLILLASCLGSMPDKKDGVADQEIQYRKRHLDLISSADARQRFLTRAKVIREIRAFMEKNGFLEVETPVLAAAASGALARPFSTHHKALDKELYLRIAPETYLKRVVAGGFDRVFEIGKNFRNEGLDPSHLQEFTAIEWYAAGFDYKQNLCLFSDLWRQLGLTEDFEQSTYADLFRSEGLSDPAELDPNQADLLYKKQIRPKLIKPTIVSDYPAAMVPMAATGHDGKTAEMWQLVWKGWEVVKCYTELVDPVKQRANFEAQAKARAAGDDEAMMLEEAFLEAMEFGMPPMSGLGIGIDRLVALICGAENLKDVILFPTLG